MPRYDVGLCLNQSKNLDSVNVRACVCEESGFVKGKCIGCGKKPLGKTVLIRLEDCFLRQILCN